MSENQNQHPITGEELPKTAPEHATFIAPAWGLTGALPEGVSLAWGARAIYSLRMVDRPLGRAPNGRRSRLASVTYEATIDLLYDRMGFSSCPGVTGSDVAKLGKWIDDTAIPAIKRICQKQVIGGDDPVVIEYASSDYKIVASPRASYGYLYLTAWRVPS
jgi:hypothetical protein